MTEHLEELDGSHGMSHTEHALRSVLSSDVESARRRLAHTLERLGYKVISEEPLYARRRARGWANYYCSTDILDYPVKLTIGLKQLSPNLTLATFDYAVEHFGGVSTKGDRQTLKREAEAVIALTESEATSSVCSACGTKQISDARFCRICGVPITRGDPAELEVLRLTSGTRAGHHLVATGALWTAVSLFITLLLIFLGANAAGLATGFFLTQIIVGLFMLFAGVRRLHKTLNPKLSQPPILPNSDPSADSAHAGTAAFLSAPPAQASITEGTTGLLADKSKEREKEFVYSKKRDTSPLD